MIGKSLGKYTIIEQLGRGGMAEVYKAYHPGLDRYVAIKVLHTFLVEEEDFLERFRREAQSVGQLRHPNIVHMYDFDTEGDIYFMVMEFLEGPSLKHKLTQLQAQGRGLTLEEAIRIVRDVGEALAYAHESGIIHRDIKPANVMLTPDGRAVLTDFGIVKMLTASTQLTASGAMIGTPAYMAPEHSLGLEGDERADVYSLGIVLYQLVTGRLPYEADTPMAVVLQHINAPLPIPSEIKSDLAPSIERILLKALAKDPENRYQTMREMLDHLDQAMEGAPIPAVDPAITMAGQAITRMFGPLFQGSDTPTPSTAGPSKGRPWWLLGLTSLILILLLGIVGGAIVLSEGAGETPTPVATTPFSTAVAAAATPTTVNSPDPNLTPNLTATYEWTMVQTLIAPTATPTPTTLPTETPRPTDTPAPTDTPDLTATATAACILDSALEQGAQGEGPDFSLGPSARFEQTWRLLNSGNCSWPPGTRLVLIAGEKMDGEEQIDVGSAVPGETREVTILLRAPRTPGTFTATWQLQTASGEGFGAEFPLQVRVVPPPTVPPTDTPEPTVTPPPTATPSRSLEMSIPVLLKDSCWANSDAGTWGGTLAWSAWGGTGTYQYYFAEIDPNFELSSPAYEFRGQIGKAWIGTLYTVSGDEMVYFDRYVPPSECEPE